MWQPGDKVAVLDSTLEGVVLRIESGRVVIEDEHGFEHVLDPEDIVAVPVDFLPPGASVRPKDTRKTSAGKTPCKDGMMEVDLHYHGDAAMEFFPVIEQQVRMFYSALNLAVRQHCRKLILIHGVGEGKLRRRLVNELSRHRIPYADAPYHRYGYGAIEVYLQGVRRKHFG